MPPSRRPPLTTPPSLPAPPPLDGVSPGEEERDDVAEGGRPVPLGSNAARFPALPGRLPGALGGDEDAASDCCCCLRFVSSVDMLALFPVDRFRAPAWRSGVLWRWALLLVFVWALPRDDDGARE